MANKLERIRGLNSQVKMLEGDIAQVDAELSMLGHIDDDAKRDAEVSGRYDDRAEARMTKADVIRMQKHLARMERRRFELVAKRDKLIGKLAAQ